MIPTTETVDLRADDGAIVCRVDGNALWIQHRWHGETRTTRVVPQATAMLQAALDAGGAQELDAGIYLIHDTLHVRRDIHLYCDDGVTEIVQVSQAPIIGFDGVTARLTSSNVQVRSLDGLTRIANPCLEYVAPAVRPSGGVTHGDNCSAG